MQEIKIEFNSSPSLPKLREIIENIAACIRDYTPQFNLKYSAESESDKTPEATKTLLGEADNLIHGDRNNDYGHPLDDFTCTAMMWTAYLKHRGLLKQDAAIQAEDVPMMMISIKQSRWANAPKRDNIVDIAGYAGTIDMCDQERLKREVLQETFCSIDDVSGD